MIRRNPVLSVLAGVVFVLLAVAGYSFVEARRDPVVREAAIAMRDWPAGAPPLRIVLLSDLHAGNLAVTPARFRRVVAQVNELRPDLILIAGDFLPGHEPVDAATATATLAPLKGLRARLGVVAVPGNHDHWTGLGAVRSALEAAGVTSLANQATARGPLAIAAVDDDYSEHARTAPTLAAARKLPGAKLVLTHSPDIAPQLPSDFPLLLAGHTHCGQAVIPFYGSLDPVSRYQDRYRCGVIREGTRTVVVTGGIGGTIPFRFNAPPDLWLLTLGPAPGR
ncbi:metallophosphoesterase [Sphingomonas psychrotolerans]|uniref:Phosphohydrolase n=1 Tax=Sphingomonas psychrotolerans TaxID=1327635 RepID=A0A2K8MNC0_9SPHN|nr:metallophosphoesterase [Sphingomonas psychrotolerans]ATY32861.1 phosphohydrolase [Sphingomonas psychrotolerans]